MIKQCVTSVRRRLSWAWSWIGCHIASKHLWVYSPGRRLRACRDCHRREYLYGTSHWGCSITHHWLEHTYPLDADPAKDPSTCDDDGMTRTLGDTYEFNKMMRGAIHEQPN